MAGHKGTHSIGADLLGRWFLVGLAFLALALLAAPLAVAAPAWLAPVDLSAAGHSTSVPQVAVDSEGDAVAVWLQFGSPIVQAATRPAGGAWSAPIDLTALGQEAKEPQVALDSAGNATAVWRRSNGKHWIVQAATLPAGGAWSAPADLSAANQDSEAPQVAVDAEGDATVVWNGVSGIVHVATRPAGGIWSAPADLSELGQQAKEPQVAINPAGDATAVWRRYDGAHYIVQSAGRPAGGAWSASTDLSAKGQDAETPQVAVDAQGDATAVWRRFDGSKWIVQATERFAGKTWLKKPADLSAAGCNAEVPQVAIDAGGEATAVWQCQFTIQSTSKPALLSTWSAPIDLSGVGQTAFSPQVSVGAQGDAAVVWWHSGNFHYTVGAATRPAGGTWSAPTDLSVAGQDAEQSQVAVDAQGDAVVVWHRYDGANYRIQAIGHDVAGPQLRGLSIPSKGTVGRQVSFGVSPLDAWASLGPTTWSFGDGGTAATANVTHVYGTPGTYSVTLGSVDTLGNASTASGTIAIAPAPAPRGKAFGPRLVIVKHGEALLRLHCSGGGCKGVVRLTFQSTDRHRYGRTPKQFLLGKSPFAIAAGRIKTVDIGLSRKAKSLLGGAGRQGLSATLGGSDVKGRKVLLRAAGHRKHP